ncbi:hypothetical protein SAMN04488589_2444 [Methanolobus vulcani]|uniref:Uncharacterized protein n=1 Tax=Methanolobus vulcani TaxID=38026 RepID=A0A7Z7AYF5_9EURY|nr:hypothetical protein SAMN04488589_2444 [Methanolobus vulcani]
MDIDAVITIERAKGILITFLLLSGIERMSNMEDIENIIDTRPCPICVSKKGKLPLADMNEISYIAAM